MVDVEFRPIRLRWIHEGFKPPGQYINLHETHVNPFPARKMFSLLEGQSKYWDPIYLNQHILLQLHLQPRCQKQTSMLTLHPEMRLGCPNEVTHLESRDHIVTGACPGKGKSCSIMYVNRASLEMFEFPVTSWLNFQLHGGKIMIWYNMQVGLSGY